MVQSRQGGFPAGLDHRRRIFLGDDGRPADDVAGPQVFAHYQRRVVPLAAGIHAHGFPARHFARRVNCMARLDRGVAGHHRFHRHGFHHQVLALHQKGKTLAVGGFKARHDFFDTAKRHNQRSVAAFVTHMHAPMRGDRPQAELLALQLGFGRCHQGIELAGNFGQSRLKQFEFNRLLADHVLVGQAHAVGTQNTRQRMHEYACHAQCIGHQAGMLAAGAAETLQGIARHVITARDRYFLDGVGHLLHRDVDEAFGHLLGAAAGLAGQFVEFLLHHVMAQRFIGLRAKHFGKVARLHLADQQVGIGHGQRPATAVAGRAGVRAGALRPDAKTLAVKFQDGATARRHRVNTHHRRTHAYTGHLGFKLALELAGVVRHVGGGAAHVKPNHFLDAGNGRSARHADNAARRATQYRVLAMKSMRVSQATRRLHEKQFDARHLAGHLIDIAAQDG